MTNKTRWIAIGVALLATMAQMASANAEPPISVTYYVRGGGNGSDTFAGTNWSTAFATIQKAFDKSSGYPTNTVTVNIEGGYTYHVANQTLPNSVATNYLTVLQGGWSGVSGGSAVQDGYSTISDTIGPIDQPGLVIQGGVTKNLTRTGIVCRMIFTNVTHGVYMVNSGNGSSQDPGLILSNCIIAAQSHGVFMEYVEGGATTKPKYRVFVTNSIIRGGQSGIGDGIRINGIYHPVDLGADSTVSSLGGVNLYLRDANYTANTLGIMVTNRFFGSFGTAAGGYDMVKYGRSSIMQLYDTASFTHPIAFYGGAIEIMAQNSVYALGNGTMNLNATTRIMLDSVSGVDGTKLGPIIVRGGQSFLGVNGVNGGGTWTADSLTRGADRAVLLLLGTGASPWYLLKGTDKFRITDAPEMHNGMVAPYLLAGSGDFLKHDATFGFTNATYTATDINVLAADKLVSITSPQTMSANQDAYALWMTLKSPDGGHITNGAGGPFTLTLGSGGLSASYNTTTIATYLSPNLKFGVSGEKEALVFVGYAKAGVPVTDLLILNGSLTTTNGLTKSGWGTLRLSGDSHSTLSGPVKVNAGRLQLDNANALPSGQSMSLAPYWGFGNYAYDWGSSLDLYGNNATLGQLTLSDAVSVGNTKAASSSTLTLNGGVVYDGYEFTASIAPSAGSMLLLDLGSVNHLFAVADGTDVTDLSIAANVIGTGGLTKKGVGRMDLSGTNTFSGGINILDGLLGATTPAIGVQTPLGDAGNVIAMTNTAGLVYYNQTSNGVHTDVGNVAFSGGNKIGFSFSNQRYATNTMTSLDRMVGTRGVLLFQGAYGYSGAAAVSVGSYAVMLATGGGPTVSNGMVAAYFVSRANSATAGDYVTYDAALGFKTFTYEKVDTFAGMVATSKVSVAVAKTIVVSYSTNVWALKTASDITNSAVTLTIGSGGLLFAGTATMQPTVKFGASDAAEALVYVDEGANAQALGVCGTMSGPLVTTAGLTKFGGGVLSLKGDSNSSFSGPVWVQAGVISMGHTNALGSTTGSDPIYIQPDARLDIGGNYSLARPIIGVGARASFISTGPNTLTIVAGGSLTPGLNEVGAMQVEDMDFRGTYNWDYNATGADLIKAVNLNFGGSATLKVNWLGTGSAPVGTYELFRYYGTAPSLGSWTVQPPTGLAGTVSVDDTNKRVTLTLAGSSGASSTIIMVR